MTHELYTSYLVPNEAVFLTLMKKCKDVSSTRESGRAASLAGDCAK